MANKIGKAPKSFKRMNAERSEVRDRNERFSGLTQSFQSVEDLRAARSAQQHVQPDVRYRDRSAEVARQLTEAMSATRLKWGEPGHSKGYTVGEQDDGSYVDRDGVRLSKAYRDNLEVTKGQLEGKGLKGQRCNRTACQAPGAYWYNHSTRAYYCGTCADLINAVNTPADSYVRDLGHPLLTLDPDFADKRDERA